METMTQRSDAAVKNDVLAERGFEPGVKVTDIGVLVKDGTVALNGFAIQSSIARVFERNAQADGDKIGVETSGNKVTLRGKVRNKAKRDEAERIAWAAPGVLSVENKLELQWGFSD